MHIRKATPRDAGKIASHLMLAMDDIVYRFTGDNNRQKALQLLEELARSRCNQYSFENCWVVEIDNEVVATANVYDGAHLHELRKPVAGKIGTQYNKEFNPEDETQAGEFYIDCVGVEPGFQGKGIGSALFRFLIEEYVLGRNQPLGLLVDKDNPGAEKLYLKLGFEVAGAKTLTGKQMHHLQFRKGLQPQ